MEKIDIGARLKAAREKAGLTQEKARKELGIPKAQTLSAYERGVNSPPIEILIKISKLYSVSMDWIILGEESPRPDDRDVSKSLENFFLAADKLGLTISDNYGYNREPLGEYHINLKNTGFRGFNELVELIYKLNTARDAMEADDYKILVTKKIREQADKSNNFEIIPMTEDSLDSEDADLPF